MSHIVMRGRRWDLVLIVHASTANINYDTKDNIYEEFEQVFDHFPTYHMKILLGWLKEKYGIEIQANSWELS
jgi:predicted 3-demethylubiquinone-9 3-methyltransferase (glyoxalase superfamily)